MHWHWNRMSTRRILVVEDEPVVAQHLGEHLQRIDFCVTVACSQAEALAYAEELKPDLVLMDICLGGETAGIGAADLIRQRFGIPVVFLTGFADAATFERAKAAGPFGYVLKPYDGRELEICIEMALYKHRIERERETLIAQLQEALASVKTLRGLLPICSYCKQIRDDGGYWNQLEDYMCAHSEVTFSHGMCPKCFQRVRQELDALEKSLPVDNAQFAGR